MEKVIYWFSRNHVAANFLMLMVLLVGGYTWTQMRKEIFPETAIDVVQVNVPYPNAAPEEVEKGVIVPIEDAIEGIDGIERVTSTAAESMGAVSVEVMNGYDVRDVMNDVKTRIDAIDNFAERAEKPVVKELLLKAQIMSVAVSADTDEKTLRELAEKVRDDLLALPEITQVELAGVRPYEISIEVSEETLREYGLTFDQVANAVRFSSLDLPAGSVKTEAGEILLRAQNKRYNEEELAEVTVLTREDGSVVKLSQIADIVDGFEDVDLRSRFDGEAAVIINVYRTGDEDTLELAEAVKRYLKEEAPQRLPEGVNVEMWNDTSYLLQGRVDLLGKNAFFGLILVFIVLALFLRLSLAIFVAIGIPVSFAGAMLLMPYLGVTINMISLFAFILVLGIVVDDAIVVGENVYRRMRLGEHPSIAAPKGTHEVGVVVIFGILTTMAAFTPMLGLSGVSGKIWPNIPLIVIPTLVFSLLQSKLVLPAHLSLIKARPKNYQPGPYTRFQHIFSMGLERFVQNIYRPALRTCLHNRWIVLASFTAVLIATVGFVKAGFLKFQFFPEVEADIISAKLVMPNGVPFEETSAAIDQLEESALRLKKEYKQKTGKDIVIHMLASTGSQPLQIGFDAVNGVPIASNIGEVTLELLSGETREMPAAELVARWRELTKPIVGALELTFASQAAGGGNAIDLELSGTDLEELEGATELVKEKLSEYNGVIDIADSNREGKREMKLKILPAGEALGLRLEDVARQVRQGFYGEEAQRLQRGRDEVKVMVRYPKEKRQSINDLSNVKIRTREGEEVPFYAVATVVEGRGFDTISHADRRRSVKVVADIDKNVEEANANEVVAKLESDVFPELKKRFPGVQFGFQGEQKDQRQSVTEIGKKALLALLLIYVLMAIPLRSYVQPLIVMCVIPFGFVGAVFGHIIMWTELSIMSMTGIVALAGVVVNDSLVLVEYVNRQRALGKSVIDAAREAGAVRFRPILLTSMTTFAGLTPMLVETSIQAKFLIPMAISLAFGILFATAITLLLVPCVYLILDDFRKLLGIKEPTIHREDMHFEIELEGNQEVEESDETQPGETKKRDRDEGGGSPMPQPQPQG